LRLCSPNFASGSQEIGDFLGVALQVQQNEVCFASLKQTNLKSMVKLRDAGERSFQKIEEERREKSESKTIKEAY